MSRPVTLFHGMSRWSWEVVRHQGQLRPAYTAQEGGRIYKVVEGRGFVYFCSEPRMAAIYAGGDPALRMPTLIGRGRWSLPGGIANQDGVVIAADFEDGELTFTHRPNSHEEYVTDRPVAADRLRLVAFIPKGSKVADALRRAEQPPPLSAAGRERLESIDPEADICWPGPLIADLEESQRPLRFLRRSRQNAAAAGAVANPEQVAAQGGDWRGALDRLAAARSGAPSIGSGQRIPPIGSPPPTLSI